MAKKKPSNSGKHVTPRKTVQFPADWLAVAKSIAVQQRRPVMWVLIELIKKEAEGLGMTDLPAGPWEDVPDDS